MEWLLMLFLVWALIATDLWLQSKWWLKSYKQQDVQHRKVIDDLAHELEDYKQSDIWHREALGKVGQRLEQVQTERVTLLQNLAAIRQLTFIPDNEA